MNRRSSLRRPPAPVLRRPHWLKLSNPIPNLAGAVLVAAVLGSCGGPEPTAGGPPPLPVEWQTLSNSEMQTSSEFVGTLQASERVVVRPQIDGRIVEVLVEEGDRVSVGTPILSLNPEQVEAQVASAGATVNTREAELLAAESSRDSVAADFQLATIESDRYVALAEDGAVSLEERDRFVRNLQVAEANLAAAEDEVDAARKRLAEAQAQLEANQVNLDYKQVTSPISGIVGDLPLRIGDVVSVGQELTTITQNSQLELNINVPVNRLGDLELGLPVELIDPNSNEVVTTGSISFISPRVDQANQTVLVKFTFTSSGNDLKDDQFVRARVIWETNPGILVPTFAVSRLGSQAFVFVVDEAPPSEGEEPTGELVASQRPIGLGPLQGQSYQVTSGLNPGDRVIVTRILDLIDGRPIVDQASVAPPAAEDGAAAAEEEMPAAEDTEESTEVSRALD